MLPPQWGVSTLHWQATRDLLQEELPAEAPEPQSSESEVLRLQQAHPSRLHSRLCQAPRAGGGKKREATEKELGRRRGKKRREAEPAGVSAGWG